MSSQSVDILWPTQWGGCQKPSLVGRPHFCIGFAMTLFLNIPKNHNKLYSANCFQEHALCVELGCYGQTVCERNCSLCFALEK